MLPATINSAADPRKELTQAMRKLAVNQRALLRRFAANPDRSLYSLAKDMGISSHSVWKWVRRPEFVKAKELIDQTAVEAIAMSRAYVLSRTRDVVERSMQAEPVLDREGNPTGEWQFAGNVALKGLEMLGRHQRMWGEDKPPQTAPVGPGLTVIVQSAVGVSGNAGPAAHRVEVRLAEPETP